MNEQRAKEILRAYRPGDPDASGPEFIEALNFVQQDENLRHWFEDQSATREIIRSKFKTIPVPEGLREQILSEYPRRPVAVSRRERVALAAFVAITLVVCFTFFWSRHPGSVPPQDDLTAFQYRMASTVLRSYPGMDLVTNDLNQIHSYLTEHVANGDYVLPAGITKADPIGCVVTSWRGQDVAMICFKSGRPMPPGQNSDVWLFVTDRAAISNAPSVGSPQIARVNRLSTETWTQNGKIYLLAVDGDEDLLKSFF
jgi:hypothetical protein